MKRLKTCSIASKNLVDIHALPVSRLLVVDNPTVIHTLFHRFINSPREVAFYLVKGYLLACERLPFTTQKAAYCRAKGYLLPFLFCSYT